MNIIINKGNRQRIEKALSQAEGRATERTVDYADLRNVANKATVVVCARTFLPASEQKGIRVGYRMALNLPNAYQYRPHYTHVTIERRASGWALVDAKRLGGNNKQAETYTIILPTDRAEESERRYKGGFHVA